MCAISHIQEVFEISKFTFCHSQIDATMVGGLIKSGTLGRGLMTLVPTCWSVCVLEMAKESGHANLSVSRAEKKISQMNYEKQTNVKYCKRSKFIYSSYTQTWMHTHTFPRSVTLWYHCKYLTWVQSNKISEWDSMSSDLLIFHSSYWFLFGLCLIQIAQCDLDSADSVNQDLFIFLQGKGAMTIA